MKKFTTWYQKILRKLMKRRRTVVGVAVALMIGTVLLAGTLDMELIPAADEGVVAVTVNFRSGTTLEKEDEALKLWEQIAEEEPDVESYSVSISGSSATLTADLIKKRTLTTAQVVDKWNEIAAGMTDMDVTVASSGSSMSSMMSTSSYEIDLQGNDRAELAQAAEDLQAEIEKIDGVVKTENSLANSTTLAKVVVDPLKAMQYGLTPIQVGMTIHNVLSGMNPLTITNDGSEYAVWLEYPEGSYDDLNLLMDLGLDTSFGTVVPLRDIAEINYAQSQETIMKQDGLYQVSVTSTMTSEKIFDAQNAINDLVDHTVFPDSVTPADSMMTGMMNDELQALLQAILVATFLVFLVMAMQFESPRFSFMVMMCIPFALIGSFLLLFITQSTISMVSLMGFLMLMGIVVNNGILFVDSANMLREEGMSTEDALVASGSTRLRPILMTTLTTILSMIPMGLGLGDNGVMMQGMALVIIGGLTASTILTLILIPTFYLIFDKRSRQERRAAKKLAKSQRSGKTGMRKMSKITGLEAPNQVPPKVTAMYRAVSTLLREDKDISEMSVSMITGLAGIGKGTAYEYFDSKEEIIVCALLYEIRTVTEQASHQIQTCPDLETQIHRMLLLVEEHSQCVDAIMAFLHLLTDHSKEGNLLRQRIAEQKENGPVDLLVRQIIDSARAKGELREDIPLSYITNALLARMISYLMYQCHHIGDDMPPEEMRRLVTESIMNELCKKNI
ncbi:MAG: efflux RND transporter permease subunit [Waltera sp.]